MPKQGSRILSSSYSPENEFSSSRERKSMILFRAKDTIVVDDSDRNNLGSFSAKHKL